MPATRKTLVAAAPRTRLFLFYKKAGLLELLSLVLNNSSSANLLKRYSAENWSKAIQRGELNSRAEGFRNCTLK